MADNELPFDTGSAGGIAQDLRSQWNSFASDPKNLTALAQFGIGLLQPDFGSPASNIGRAIGGAGEAVTRQQEAESKQELRTAQAQAAEARAATAGQASANQAERLAFEREKLNAQQRVKLALGYGPYETGVNNRNRQRMDQYEKDKILNPTLAPPTLEPVLGPEEWLSRQSGVLGPTGIVPAPRTAAPTPTTQGPKVGDVVNGYVFQGGDPNSQSSWKKQ